jgi:hypothetical protein
MTRFFTGLIWIGTLSFVICLFPSRAVATEPDEHEPKTEGKLYLGGFEKSLPLAIGGGITVGIVWAGFFLLNTNQPEPRASASRDAGAE